MRKAMLNPHQQAMKLPARLNPVKRPPAGQQCLHLRKHHRAVAKTFRKA